MSFSARPTIDRAPSAKPGVLDIDAMLMDYILRDEDQEGGEYILLDEEPTPLGDEVLCIVIARISDHPALARTVDVDRVRSALIEEYGRHDALVPVALDALGAYIRAMAPTPREASLCLLDIAWGLREAGYRTSLDKEGPGDVIHADPLRLRQQLRPKGEYVVQATVAADRPWERLVRNTLRLSFGVGLWLVASSCIGF